MTELDITSESERAYHYPDGSRFVIEAPCKLHVLETGSHRVIGQDGRTYRPERGWIGISWLPREGQPAFIA